MDLISIDCGTFRLIQGAVRIDWPDAAQQGPSMGRFVSMLRATMRSSMAVPFASRFVALDLSPSQGIVTDYAWTCAPEAEPTLRMVLAALIRLGAASSAEVTLPQNAADFERAFVRCEAERYVLDSGPVQTSGGGEIAHGLRLFDLLDDLSVSTSAMNLGFRLECAIVAQHPNAEDKRTGQYRIAHLQRETAAPEDLVHDQINLANKLAAATHHCVEAITPGPGGHQIVHDLVTDALRATPYGRIGLQAALHEADPDEADALGFLTHPAIMLAGSDDGVRFDAAGFISAAEAEARLSLSRLCERLDVSAATADVGKTSPIETVIALRSMAEAPTGRSAVAADDPFLFISYARADWARVKPIIEALTARDVRTWIDNDIRGGDLWLDELETQIVQSAGLLTFVSDAYMQSRYCLGEARFALTLDKPFIPVRLDEAELSGGLALMFASYQFIPSHDSAFLDRLMVAISRHAAPAMGKSSAPSVTA